MCWCRDLERRYHSGPNVNSDRRLTTFVVVLRQLGSIAHTELKSLGWLDARIEPLEIDVQHIAFPLNTSFDAHQRELKGMVSFPMSIIEREAEILPAVDPHERLRLAIEVWMNGVGIPVNDKTAMIPKKWERLGHLALFQHEVFTQDVWKQIRKHREVEGLWRAIADALKVDAIGIQHAIADDEYRSSQVELLLGTSQVEFVDHGIIYAFDAAKVMFSSGNITERRRIGSIEMTGEKVIDAFAGVGYYTFPMLIHGKAAHVHACEFNPHSLEGLRLGSRLNGIEKKITIHEGDNRQSLPKLRGSADRCHLGLLPSSEAVWLDCLLALKPSGGCLHVHMNVEEENINSWAEETVHRFQSMADEHQLGFTMSYEHLEKVKWFAPRVRHVVLDVRAIPSATIVQ